MVGRRRFRRRVAAIAVALVAATSTLSFVLASAPETGGPGTAGGGHDGRLQAIAEQAARIAFDGRHVVTASIGRVEYQDDPAALGPGKYRWTFLADRAEIAFPVRHADTSGAAFEPAPVATLTLPILTLSATVPSGMRSLEPVAGAVVEPVAIGVDGPGALPPVVPDLSIDPTLAPLDVPLGSLVPSAAPLLEAPVAEPSAAGDDPKPPLAAGQRAPVKPRSGRAEEKPRETEIRARPKPSGLGRPRSAPPVAAPAGGTPDWWPFDQINSR